MFGQFCIYAAVTSYQNHDYFSDITVFFFFFTTDAKLIGECNRPSRTDRARKVLNVIFVKVRQRKRTIIVRLIRKNYIYHICET